MSPNVINKFDNVQYQLSNEAKIDSLKKAAVHIPTFESRLIFLCSILYDQFVSHKVHLVLL